MAGHRIYGDLTVDGTSLLAGAVTLGKSDTSGTTRTFTAAGSESNIGIDFVPNGTGILRVPADYEDNIGSEARALINKAYHDVNIAGIGTAITSPGQDRILFYDHSGTAFNWLELDPSLEVSGTTLSVIDNTTVQKIAVRKNTTGSDIGTRRRINFIEGSNISITVADNSTDDEINVTIDGDGGAVSFGSEGQIPFINATTDDLSYSGQFKWTDSNGSFLASKGLTVASNNLESSFIQVQNSTITCDFRWSAIFGDVHNLTNGACNNTLIAGTAITATGGNFGGNGVFGSAHSVSGTGTKGRHIISGDTHTITSNFNVFNGAISGNRHSITPTAAIESFHLSGIRGLLSGSGNARFIHAFNIASQTTRPVIAEGNASVNISSNSSSQTSGHGALANYSVILGGQDHNIPSDSPGAVILGGNAIKARAATSNEVYVTGLTLAAGALTGLNVAAPSAITDAFRMYATDITAGNSAPHFKTENGDVIRLYADSGWTKMTGTPEKGTFDTATVTLAELAGKVMALEAVLFDNVGFLKA
jgi:hypothetical protein